MDVLKDLSPAALGSAVEENASSLWPSWAAWKAVTFTSHGHWRRILSSVHHPAFNQLYGLDLDTKDPAAVLAGALAPFREAGLPCFCWVDPVTGQRHRRLLDDAGLEYLFAAPGMAVALKNTAAYATAPPDLTVQEVATEEDLEAWCATVGAASDFSPEAAGAWLELHQCIPFGPGTARRHFIGRLDGKAVGTSSLLFAGGVAGLYSVTVPHEFRRRGFGTALSTAALATARREGFRAAALVSTSSGLGIYRRLGFREYRRWECRLLPAP